MPSFEKNGAFYGAFCRKGWENSGKNPSHPEKFA